MSELRDARFQRALEFAPDAHMLPAAATRHAIGQAARAAASPAAPWWKRLALPAPGRRMPWNAGFATLLLASLVTLLWRDREISGAVPDSPVAQLPAPAQAPPAAVPAAPAAAVASVAPAEPARKAAPRAQAARKPVEPPRMPDEAAAPLAKSGAAPPPETRQADTAASAGSIASERAAPMAAPAARTAREAAPAPAPAPALAQNFAPVPPWAAALITVEGRTVEVAREQSVRLAQLVAAAASAASGTEPLAEPAGEKVELLGPPQAQGVLEIAGAQVRWTQGGRVRSGRPDAALLQALRDELRRFAAR